MEGKLKTVYADTPIIENKHQEAELPQLRVMNSFTNKKVSRFRVWSTDVILNY